ncbi:hypothetical protein ACRRTK_019669 [Alexandromys fortis]
MRLRMARRWGRSLAAANNHRPPLKGKEGHSQTQQPLCRHQRWGCLRLEHRAQTGEGREGPTTAGGNPIQSQGARRKYLSTAPPPPLRLARTTFTLIVKERLREGEGDLFIRRASENPEQGKPPPGTPSRAILGF